MTLAPPHLARCALAALATTLLACAGELTGPGLDPPTGSGDLAADAPGADDTPTPTIVLHGGGGGAASPPSHLERFAGALPADATVLLLANAPSDASLLPVVRSYAAPFGRRPVLVVRTTAAGTGGGDTATEASLASLAAQLAADGLDHIQVVTRADANADEVVAAAARADFVLVPGGDESRLAHVSGTRLGAALLEAVGARGATFHGMSAGAMAALEHLSSTAFFRPLQPGLGLRAGATVLAHAERVLASGPPPVTQRCAGFRAVGEDRARVAIAVGSDSYAVLRGDRLEVAAPFDFVRDGVTIHVAQPVLIFRADRAKPAGLDSQRPGDPIRADEAAGWTSCGAAVEAAIAAGAPTAMDGAIEIVYPGTQTTL